MEYRVSSYRWLILFFAIIAYSIEFMQRMSPTVIADTLIQEFNVSGAFIGLLAGTYFYPYAFMQIPGGILSDRISPRYLMSGALFLSTIGTFIFAFSPNVIIALIGRFLVGFGLSFILMSSCKILANWFTLKSFVVIISILMAIGGGLGSILAGAPLALLITKFDWREAYIGIALVSLVVSGCVWIFLKESPVKMGLPLPEAPRVEKLNNISIKEAIKIVLTKRNFWLIALTFLVSAATYFSFIGLWAGIFYMDVCGFTRAELGTLLSVSATITIATPILFASLTTRIRSFKTLMLIATVALILVMLWLYIGNGSWSKQEVFIWGMITPIVFTAPPSIFMGAVRQIVPPSISGTATGLVYTAPMLGSATYQPLIGYILDKSGFVDTLTAQMFDNVILLYLGTATLSLFFVLALKEKNSTLLSV